MSELTIRQAHPADVPHMLRIVCASFEPWPRFEVGVSQAAHFAWKLGPGGIDDIGEHTVVELDERIVASRLRWIGRVDIRGQQYVTETGADLAVDPDYQGRGIGREMNAYREVWQAGRGHLNFGAASRREQRGEGPQQGRYHRSVTIWSRYPGLGQFARIHPKRGDLPQAARAAVRVATQRLRRRPPTGRTDAIIELDRFDGRTDDLWRRARTSFDVAPVRTASYLNWRYRDARGGDTLLLAVFEGQRCLAYGVFKPDGAAATVVDLLIDPERLPVGASLLATGFERMRERGCQTLRCWLPRGHAYGPVLRRAGFVEAGESSFNFANSPPTLDGPPEVSALAADPATRFHVTLGNFDFV